MKVIFLDIDGVLNTDRCLDKQATNNDGVLEYEMMFNFDPIAMKNLRKIVLATEAMIVISSTWRIGKDMYWDEIVKNLKRYKIDSYLIGKTPILLNEIRGKEIEMWLKAHSNVESFVILDDDMDMGNLMENLALCKAEYGITSKVKREAIRILGRG